MKTITILGMLSVCFMLRAQTTPTQVSTPTLPAQTPYAVVSRDANSAVWQGETYTQESDGTINTNVHHYVELATGLNHLVGGQWLPSTEEIDISSDGSSAMATNGQHQVYFPGDIYNGEIKLVMPDGTALQSQPIGLSYFDGSNSVLIAELTNSSGAILPSGNQVIYTNAFAGLDADLLYTYTKAGFEQDVILREQPPDPTALGLNPQTTRLQVLTEFFNVPQPSINATTVPTAAGNLEDDALSFGVMQIGQGKAFMIGANSPSVGVNKQWFLLNGKQFLVEEVPIVSISQDIDSLPPFVAKNGLGTKAVVSRNPIPPLQRLTRVSSKAKFLAQGPPPSRGLVLDYQTINSSQTNYTFQGDTTYYISGSLNLYGTNTFEGGTVVKYTNGASIYVEGPVNCNTGPYRPAVFTAKDDNSVGEGISGSTGNPSGVYAGIALEFYHGAVLQHLRIEYASTGIEVYTAGLTNRDSQFCNDANPFICQYGSSELENDLIYNTSGTALTVSSAGIVAENLTVHDAATFLGASAGGISLTNSLLISCTNLGSSFGGGYNYTNSSDAGIFQTVGGGANYLATNCPAAITNSGTTNIDPTLLADLQTKTTCPPIAYTNVTFTNSMTLNPQAPLDTNATPELGYHYDPIDYSFGGCIANSNITFTAGTAVGWFRTTSGWGIKIGQGLYLQYYTTASFQGTEQAPDYWVRLNTVQENDTTGGYGPGGLTGGDYLQFSNSIVPAPVINLSFTRCSIPAGDGGGNHFRDDYWGYLVIQAKHSEFYGGGIGAYGDSCYFTNCLMERMYGAQVQGWSGDQYTMRNCTWHGGRLELDGNNYPIPISVRDCSFDGTTFTLNNYGTNSGNAGYDYNAFTNGATRFPIGGSHDVTNFTSFNWQTGPLGNYYLPTNSTLIHAGDVLASQVGLYHFTITTNEIPEGTNIVSIGYHYVALDQYGNPLDSNGDGIPDYLEDANGDGLYDPGDPGNWQTLNLNVIITRPRNGSILP